MIEQVREFNRIVSDPLAYGEQLKRKNEKTVFGYFCSYTPEEIIHAAGLHPFRLLGTGGATLSADERLQSCSCDLIRETLELALTGRLAFLSGVVFPRSCDAFGRLSDIWRLNAKIRYHFDIVLPERIGEEGSLEPMVDALKIFRRNLEIAAKTVITDSAMERSFELYNSIRTSLKKIYLLRSANPGALGGRDLYAIVRACMLMERRELDTLLRSLLEELGAQPPLPPNGKKRIVIAGIACDHPDFYSLVERCGGTVVWTTCARVPGISRASSPRRPIPSRRSPGATPTGPSAPRTLNHREAGARTWFGW
jgi:benzoyl-CoA reductase/2-hydroxyglutaryl-CoA dehydratase subunit BcrC/BadD/HgdB